MEEEKKGYFERLKQSFKKMSKRDRLLCLLLSAAILVLVVVTYTDKRASSAAVAPAPTQSPVR